LRRSWLAEILGDRVHANTAPQLVGGGLKAGRVLGDEYTSAEILCRL
jgi:hypothetical protein